LAGFFLQIADRSKADAQRGVDFVGDTGHQNAQRGHFFRLRQLVLRILQPCVGGLQLQVGLRKFHLGAVVVLIELEHGSVEALQILNVMLRQNVQAFTRAPDAPTQRARLEGIFAHGEQTLVHESVAVRRGVQ
jgi:hypothetical protein